MSKRNNERRAGAKKSAPAVPVPPVVENDTQIPEQATSFSFTTPTEFVDLPSLGRYYPEDHILHNKESVEIRFMTAKDEDILASKTLLRKGVAIDRFLKNILVDKTIDVDSLLVGDKNAIMIAARTTGYGAHYETKVTCPACAGVSDYEFNLDFCPVNHGDISEEPDITHDGGNLFSLKLPATGANIQIKLLTGHDEKRFTSALARKKKNNLPDISNITDLCKVLIATVEGSDKPGIINNFVNSLPAFDSRYIRQMYDVVMPNIDMKHDFLCQHCGTDTTLEVPLNAEFFWPK